MESRREREIHGLRIKDSHKDGIRKHHSLRYSESVASVYWATLGSSLASNCQYYVISKMGNIHDMFGHNSHVHSIFGQQDISQLISQLEAGMMKSLGRTWIIRVS